MMGCPEVREPPPNRRNEASCNENDLVVAGCIFGVIPAEEEELPILGERIPGEPR